MKAAATLRVHAAATVLAVAALVISHVAPYAAQSAPAAAPQRPSAPIPPLGGVAGMKKWFNANEGHVRAIFLLSPT